MAQHRVSPDWSETEGKDGSERGLLHSATQYDPHFQRNRIGACPKNTPNNTQLGLI